MIKLELHCPGKHGSNGCPENHSLFEHSEHGVEQLQAAWERLRKRADAAWWVRDTIDQKYRCPNCCGLHTVSGYSMDVWDRAFALWQAGNPPSQWAGKDGLPTLRQWHNAVHRIDTFAMRLKDSPLYVPRKSRNPVLQDTMWQKVLARFGTGESKQDICTGGDWPTAKQWNAKMERDASFRQQINEEWDRRSQAADAKVDTAFELWQSSRLTLLEATKSPAVMQRWYVRMSKDKAFAKKVNAIWEERRPSRRAVEQLFSNALDHVKSGGLVKNLPANAAKQGMIAYRRGMDPDFAALWWSSLPERKAQFDLSLDWDGLLDAVKQGHSIARHVGKDNRPTQSQWNYRRRKDKAFAQAADEALELGKATRAQAKAKRSRNSKQHAQQIGEAFMRQLAQNDLYAAINAAVPVALAPHMRDDIISAMTLAVLEGELSIDDIAAKARDYKAQYNHAFECYQTVSIDQTIPGTNGLSRLETLSNEDALYFDYDQAS